MFLQEFCRSLTNGLIECPADTGHSHHGVVSGRERFFIDELVTIVGWQRAVRLVVGNDNRSKSRGFPASENCLNFNRLHPNQGQIRELPVSPGL